MRCIEISKYITAQGQLIHQHDDGTASIRVGGRIVRGKLIPSIRS